jgi:hypothetical protein
LCCGLEIASISSLKKPFSGTELDLPHNSWREERREKTKKTEKTEKTDRGA